MSLAELKEALKTNLDHTGFLNMMKAALRAEIYRTLDQSDYENEKKPPVEGMQLIAAELFKDFLIFSGYQHTLSVFLQESGQPSETLDKHFLAQDLHISNILAQDPNIPLLYGIISMLQKNLHQKSVPQRPLTMRPPQPQYQPPSSTSSSLSLTQEDQ